MTDQLVSVIIPSLGRFAPLISSVRDVLDQDYRSLEVIVIDQNLAWPPEQLADRSELMADPRVRWVENFPIGVVRARNHAVSLARGSLLLFVDDDVWIPDTRFVRRHVDAHEASGVACVCGRELKMFQMDEAARAPREPSRPERADVAAGSALQQILAFDRSQPRSAVVPALSTCNASIKLDAFLRVGGFDEGFQGASYGDDADLALRLHARGERIVYDSSAWLVHLLAPAGGLRMNDPKNAFSERDKCVSGLIVLFRHAGIAEAWPILYGWVLRRSVLLRRNVVRPWRQPRVVLGLASATIDALRAVRRGPQSALTPRG